MEFVGFPPGVKYTPIPNPVFGPLLEEMDDLEELKVTLRIHWMVHQKKGFPRFVTLQELMGDSTLARAIKAQGTDLEEALKKALSKAIQRHTLLHTTLQQHGKREEVYLPNTQANRRAVATLEGQESAPVGEGTLEPWQGPIERPNIFALYEQNIGMLTPLVAEEMKEAEQVYPYSWIEEAFREAATHNKRSWRYVARILERWAAEGKDDGEFGRHSKTIDAKEYLRRYTP